MILHGPEATEDRDVLVKEELDLTAIQASIDAKADLVDGKVPSAQLPSYVDDVLEFTDLASFPATGEAGKIYIDLTTNFEYRWGGSVYVVMSPSLALGETSATAYRGDRGKLAYDHSQITNGNPHGVTKAHVGLGNANDTSDANKPVSTAQAAAIAEVTVSPFTTAYVAGAYNWTHGSDLDSIGTATMQKDRIYYEIKEKIFRGGGRIGSVGFYISTSHATSAAHVRVCLYLADAAGLQPNTTLWVGAEQTVPAGSAAAFYPESCDVAVPKNSVVIAALQTDVPTLTITFKCWRSKANIAGLNDPAGTAWPRALRVDRTYAAFPDPGVDWTNQDTGTAGFEHRVLLLPFP